ncbi:hypothetical protein MRBLMF1_000920 [Streptomyces ossamyceticus]
MWNGWFSADCSPAELRPGPCHRTVAGLAPAAPGYRRLRITPLLSGGITQAGARLHTPYGTAEVFLGALRA